MTIASNVLRALPILDQSDFLHQPFLFYFVALIGSHVQRLRALHILFMRHIEILQGRCTIPFILLCISFLIAFFFHSLTTSQKSSDSYSQQHWQYDSQQGVNTASLSAKSYVQGLPQYQESKPRSLQGMTRRNALDRGSESR